LSAGYKLQGENKRNKEKRPRHRTKDSAARFALTCWEEPGNKPIALAVLARRMVKLMAASGLKPGWFCTKPTKLGTGTRLVSWEANKVVRR
jgi:hypothetical protein